MSAAQVAEVTGLSAATAHRILKTLQSQAYLEQDPQTRAYSLGIGILKLASNIADRHNEVAILASTMNRIREITGETISLHRRVGDRRVCIAEDVLPPAQSWVASGVGKSYPLNGGAAASKAIMSLLPDEEIERILDLGNTDPGLYPPSRQSFLRAIAETRERGYASSRGETGAGRRGRSSRFRSAGLTLLFLPGAIDLA